MKKLWVLFGCIVVLTGCTKSNTSTPTPAPELTPDQNVYSRGIEIDWDLVREDWNDSFADPSLYPKVHSLDYIRDDDAETLDIFIYVRPDTTAEDMADYATDAIKGLNDTVAMQDFSFEKSSQFSYGSFVTIYTVNLVVAPYETRDDESTWLIHEEIPDFEYKEISLDEEE